jgi:hypothetical protein
LSIPEWKWEVVTIYFMTNFPRTTRNNDSIMVVMENLINVSHVLLVKTTHKVTNIADIYMKEIARPHGVPKEIMSNRDPKFTSNFWKGLFNGFGTNLNFNTTYHPNLDVKTKRTN